MRNFLSKGTNINNSRTIWRPLGVIVALVVIGAGLVATFAVGQERQKVLTEKITVLKTEGCDKSDRNEKDILVMQRDITYIRKTTDDIKKLIEKEP